MTHAIDQGGNGAHLGYHSGTAERPGRWPAKNGIVHLERAVGSLGCRTEGMQLLITIGPSRDFEDEPGVLSNRDMTRKAEALRTMGAIPVEFEIRGETGFDALLETGEGKPTCCRIETVGTSEEVTAGNIRPTVAIVASFKESFAR